MRASHPPFPVLPALALRSSAFPTGRPLPGPPPGTMPCSPLIPDTLCNELDQERKARYAIQQKLKGTGAGRGAGHPPLRDPIPPSLSGREVRGSRAVTAPSLCRGPRRAASFLLQNADPAALHGQLLLQAAAAAPVSPPPHLPRTTPPPPFPRSHAGRAHTSHFHEETLVHRGLGARLSSDWQYGGERPRPGGGGAGHPPNRAPSPPGPPIRSPNPPPCVRFFLPRPDWKQSGYVQWI